MHYEEIETYDTGDKVEILSGAATGTIGTVRYQDGDTIFIKLDDGRTVLKEPYEVCLIDK